MPLKKKRLGFNTLNTLPYISHSQVHRTMMVDTGAKFFLIDEHILFILYI